MLLRPLLALLSVAMLDTKSTRSSLGPNFNMEIIYIAQSKSFPGMVKIGRTDVDVKTRMDQLSSIDYGPSGSEIDSDWEAINAFTVNNNEIAEKLLHDHFSQSRVEGRRELFYTDDPEQLCSEAKYLTNGEAISDSLEILDVLESISDIAFSISSVTGVTFLVHHFYPNETTSKMMDRKIDFIEKLSEKSRTADTPIKKHAYNAASIGLSLLGFLGAVAVLPVIAIAEGNKEVINDIKNGIKSKKRSDKE